MRISEASRGNKWHHKGSRGAFRVQQGAAVGQPGDARRSISSFSRSIPRHEYPGLMYIYMHEYGRDVKPAAQRLLTATSNPDEPINAAKMNA